MKSEMLHTYQYFEICIIAYGNRSMEMVGSRYIYYFPCRSKTQNESQLFNCEHLHSSAGDRGNSEKMGALSCNDICTVDSTRPLPNVPIASAETTQIHLRVYIVYPIQSMIATLVVKISAQMESQIKFPDC